MRRPVATALTLVVLSAAAAATAQTAAPAPAPSDVQPAKKPAAPAKSKKKAAKPAVLAPAAARVEAAAPAEAPAAPVVAPAPNPAMAQPAAPQLDPEEFRRQVMEEVRRELQKTKDEVKQETAWVEQDSQARVQDSEAVEQLRQRVNLFQPHGYLRLRPEFFYNADLGRGIDPTGHTLFPVPIIGASGGNHSISDANIRFRFEPTLEISEDLAIYSQIDVLDNVLLGSDPVLDPYLNPNTPLAVFTNSTQSATPKVKRLWGRVNTQLGELVFGRMGYHWGLGILHNDGNCLDCDFGDTFDRVAFSPRDFKGFKVTAMMDYLAKGQGTSGEYGELGRNVDLDTLDDGYRLAVEAVRLDTAEEAKRKLDAGQWVVNFGLVVDYRTQAWETVPPATTTTDGLVTGFAGNRNNVVQRKAKIYQPDAFLSLRHGKFRLDAEVALNIGNVGSRATSELNSLDNNLNGTDAQPLSFFGSIFAVQSDVAFLPADAVLLGLELGGASGDKGIYGFGARPWRTGSGGLMGNGTGEFRATAPGDIDGPRFNFADPGHSHGHVNTFMFNRAYNIDTILFRNIVSTVASAWYIKPSIRFRPTGRKSGGGDDTGFELFGSAMVAGAWYPENTPGLDRMLGVEGNVGITYDTSDRFHIGLSYALLYPLAGLRNVGGTSSVSGQALNIPAADPGIAHAVRAMLAIPF